MIHFISNYIPIKSKITFLTTKNPSNNINFISFYFFVSGFIADAISSYSNSMSACNARLVFLCRLQ